MGLSMWSDGSAERLPTQQCGCWNIMDWDRQTSLQKPSPCWHALACSRPLNESHFSKHNLLIVLTRGLHDFPPLQKYLWQPWGLEPQCRWHIHGRASVQAFV